MATAMREIPPGALVLMALLAADEKAKGESREGPTVREVSGLLYDLQERGVSLDMVSLRPVPGGYYSEDVERQIGQYLAAGYATQRSPFTLTEHGRRLCWQTLGEIRAKYSSEVETLARMIGLALQRVAPTTG